MLWASAFAVLFLWLPYAILLLLLVSRLKIRSAESKSPQVPVAVVVAFRNEAENLPQLIEALKIQTYSQVRFILVDDHSDDDSLRLAQTLTAGDERFTVLTLPQNLVGKKSALNMGIENTNTPIVLFTDADCRPQPAWIACMESEMVGKHAGLVSGTVLINPTKRFFERLQAVELNFLVGIGHALIDLGYPLLCNGASMAVTRDVAKLPAKINLSSGDDIFRLHIAVAQGFNVSYLNSPNSHVFTQAEPTCKRWLAQRIRWAAKTSAYQPVYTRFFSAVPVFGQLSILLFVFLLPVWLWALLYALKITLEWLFIRKASHVYQQSFGLLEIITVGFFYPWVTLVIGAGSLFYRPLWKGRTIR